MKRKRRSIPVCVIWNKRDQIRFIETVERLSSLVHDIAMVLEPAKRRKKMCLTPAAPAASV
jgi:hypothetical protein